VSRAVFAVRLVCHLTSEVIGGAAPQSSIVG
jgi:hypothetical protein